MLWWPARLWYAWSKVDTIRVGFFSCPALPAFAPKEKCSSQYCDGWLPKDFIQRQSSSRLGAYAMSWESLSAHAKFGNAYAWDTCGLSDQRPESSFFEQFQPAHLGLAELFRSMSLLLCSVIFSGRLSLRTLKY